MKVSFIIPTLNRRYSVVRAVSSCIAAGEHAQVPFEVIVLDSQSDDGSWEALNQKFGADPRVLLRQNRRGLGPTRSWLDGAEHISGTAVTFVWSDDFVAPSMVSDLLPPIEKGSEIAIGRAMIRDVNDSSPLPEVGASEHMIDPVEVAVAYFGLSKVVEAPPVSPACALFGRRAFDRWRRVMLDQAENDLLTQQLMWRRAIGPDLLLFLSALDMQQRPLTYVDKVLTQFSSHEDSISISSPEWLLRGGYLAARISALLDFDMFQSVSPRVRNLMLLRTALQALKLSRGIPVGQSGLEETNSVAALARNRARQLIGAAGARSGWSLTARQLAWLIASEMRRSHTAGAFSMAART